jgi:hypothetical protein
VTDAVEFEDVMSYSVRQLEERVIPFLKLSRA